MNSICKCGNSFVSNSLLPLLGIYHSFNTHNMVVSIYTKLNIIGWLCQLQGTFIKDKISPHVGNPNSRVQQTLVCGIQNPENICLWNPI